MTSIRDCIINMHPLMQEFKDTVESMWSEGLSHISPLPREDQLQKSADEAKRYRKSGNEAYRQKKMAGALKLYTKSVAHAPNDSLELRLAYDKRSVVNLFKENYTLCLLDVNRALNGTLPVSAKQTLLNRKKDCSRKLQAQNEWKSKIKKTIKRSKSGIRPLSAIERKWLYAHNMSINETDYKIEYNSFDDPIWQNSFDNASVPGVISKVEFSHDDVHGRHLVARENIKPGEVISVQEIFAIVTNMNTKSEYCSYCTLWCEALIPCLTCTVELYCSESCRTKAYDLYHRSECKVISSIVSENFDVSEKWLPLRIFLTGTQQGSSLMELMRDSKVFDILRGERESVAVQYPTNDYFGILSLTWNIDKKVPPPDRSGGDNLLKDSKTFDNMVHLFELLQHMDYFNIEHESTEIRRLTDPELFAGLLLLHHIAVTKRYKFRSDVKIVCRLENNEVVARQDTKVGFCVGSVEHFMNHSCDSNTKAITDRRRLMVLSLRPIKIGEQIFKTYNYLCYQFEEKSSRQKLLASNFNTICKCRACVERWPVVKSFDHKDKYIITKNNDLIRHIKETRDWLIKIALLDPMLIHKYKEADLQRALRFNKSIRQQVKEPFPTIVLCEMFIGDFMEKKGNRYVDRKLPSTFEPGDELEDFIM